MLTTMKAKIISGLFAVALFLLATPVFADTVSVVSDTDVDVVGVYNKAGGGSTLVPTNMKAVRAQEPKPYPTGYVHEGSEVTNSVWDNDVSWSFQTNAPTADWIWETERAEGPADYDVSDPLYDADASKWGRVVVFEKTFDIDGIPGNGTLHVAADNGWEVLINGEYLARSSTVVAGWETSNLHQAYLTTSGWQTVGDAVVPSSMFDTGENTITILAGNEYYDNDDSPNTDVPAYRADPYRQLNPGALIFKMDVNYTPVEPLVN